MSGLSASKMEIKKKILLVFGTRPEAIKMAPIIQELNNQTSFFDFKVCVTAQHREMLDQVLNFFEIIPDYDLDLMHDNQSLNQLTSRIFNRIESVFIDFKPEYVFVHGDTTTTLATALAAFNQGIKICHIEAGLRTFNLQSPFPEEMNRQVVSKIANFHFSPTINAGINLKNEGIPDENVCITGNTVIDALMWSIEKANNVNHLLLNSLGLSEGNYILITGHRRENHGEGIRLICDAILKLSQLYPAFKFVYPVHLNPKIQDPVNEILGRVENVLLIQPLEYSEFLTLMLGCKLIISDSGGVQEEAPSLNKPVLVTRETTERPEAVDCGTVILVGSDKDKIIRETIRLLDDDDEYQRIAEIKNPYGDGNSSKRILEFIKKL